MPTFPAPLGDGKHDCTPAFDALVAQAAPSAATITFPPGCFAFRGRPRPIPTGVCLAGDGSVGPSPNGYGTSLQACYDEPDPEAGFLTWDGSGSPRGRAATGAGGGIANLRVEKGAGVVGGTAVKLCGTLLADGVTGDDARRCGWWTADRVIVTGYDHAGAWDHAVLADGTPFQTSGGQGIREVIFIDLYATWARVPYQTVLLRNVTQCQFRGGLIFPAGAQPNQGLWVSGAGGSLGMSHYVQAHGLKVIGRLTVENTNQFRFDGVWEDLVIDRSASAGKVSGVYSGTLTNGSSTVVVDATKF